MRYILLFFYLFLISCYEQEKEIPYLNTSISVEKRIDDLMSRMTLYEKACQMNQFVGLEHMKKMILKDFTKVYFLKMLSK